MRTQIVHGADGAVRAIRHSWSFDHMFSAFATTGLPAKTQGAFTREELAPLAEVNVTSLQEYEYFTFAKADGKRVAVNAPTDYWLEFTDGVLTLHFTLALRKPIKTPTFSVEIYDPTAYIDFAFDDGDAVTLAGASDSCKLTVERPKRIGRTQALSLGEAFFNSLSRSSNFGAQFAGKIFVQCP